MEMMRVMMDQITEHQGQMEFMPTVNQDSA